MSEKEENLSSLIDRLKDMEKSMAETTKTSPPTPVKPKPKPRPLRR